MKMVYAINVAATIDHAPKNVTLLALRLGANSLRYCKRMAVLTRKLRGQYMTCPTFAHYVCQRYTGSIWEDGIRKAG
jgi:hypothetical protein